MAAAAARAEETRARARGAVIGTSDRNAPFASSGGASSAAPNRYVCIHGHFYQPPRENPWLEAIEGQPSAYPYHDWNERISAECYAPNANARILDGDNRIVAIVNNYASMSFNFGPTLLSWLEEKDPRVYRADPRRRRGEPQAVRRPRLGPRAAVQPHDSAARQRPRPPHAGRLGRAGLRAPVRTAARGHVAAGDGRGRGDARGARRAGDRLHDPRAAPGRPGPPPRRRSRGPTSPTGRSIRRCRTAWRCRRAPRSRSSSTTVRSRAPSPSSACSPTGERFAERLAGAFRADGERPQLVHIATDGETYGHHHRHGDMALAYALHTLEARPLAHADELRRVSREAPAHARGADRGKHLVELRARGRALEERLRMPVRSAPGLEPGVARPAARARSMRCATRWRRSGRRRRRRCSTIRGARATTTSASSSTGARSRSGASSPRRRRGR